MTTSEPSPFASDPDQELQALLDEERTSAIEMNEDDRERNEAVNSMLARLAATEFSFPFVADIEQLRSQISEKSGLEAAQQYLDDVVERLSSVPSTDPDHHERLVRHRTTAYFVLTLRRLAATRALQKELLEEAEMSKAHGDDNQAAEFLAEAYDVRKEAEARVLTDGTLGESFA